MNPPGQPMKRLNFSNTYGKTSNKTRQQLWVIHTGETPLDHGYAASLTRWAAKSGDPYVSWHRFVDPSLVVTWIPLSKGAWHATWANGISIGYEQSGYAKFTRDTWMSAKGKAQMDLLAQQIVDDGIPKDAVRWLSTSEVNAVKAGNRSIKGLCTHAQIDPANRYDPGKGYPKDVLLDWIKHYHPKFPGGDDMPLTDDDIARIWKYRIQRQDGTDRTSSAERMQSGTQIYSYRAQKDTAAIEETLDALVGAVNEIAEKLGTTPVPED